MTNKELAEGLGLTAGTVSVLCKRGMPRINLAAANRWRELHAPPRKPKAQTTQGSVAGIGADEIQRKHSDASTDEDEAAIAAGILESVRRARMAERWAMTRLVDASGRPKLTHEAFRRANSCYIAARQNRSAAERDWREWRRVDAETILGAEVQDIASRPAKAAAPILAGMPAELAHRLHGASSKETERALAEWCDALANSIRQAL